jgi:hypothetical protein
MENFLCPRDQTPLSLLEGGSWHCAQCRGTWFPYRVVALTLGHVPKPDPKSVPAGEKLRCPEHGVPLLPTKHRKGPEVDVCARCGGVWLDPGEQDLIVTALKPAYVAAEAPGVAPAAAAATIAPATFVEGGISAAAVRNEEDLEGDRLKQEFRDRLRNPRLRDLAVVPLWFFIGLPLMLGMAAWLGRTLGISMDAAIALGGAAVMLPAIIMGRRYLSLREMDEEFKAHEASLSLPALGKLLRGAEALLMAVYMLVIGPMLGGKIAPPGDYGFGGIIFLVLGFFIVLGIGTTVLLFQQSFLQDAYLPRILMNVFWLWLLVHLVTSAQDTVRQQAEARTAEVQARAVQGAQLQEERARREPLHTLLRSDSAPSRLDEVDALLAAGIDVNARGEDRRTPLMLAGAHPTLVRHLIAKGADVHAMTSGRWETILDLYEQAGYAESAAILRAAGGRRGAEITSPSQWKAVARAVGEGPYRCDMDEHYGGCGSPDELLQCMAMRDCGELLEAQHEPGGRVLRRVRSNDFEFAAHYDKGVASVVELVVRGARWGAAEFLVVGQSRAKVDKVLGPPALVDARGCSVYRSPRAPPQQWQRYASAWHLEQVTFCFEDEEGQRISEIRWSAASIAEAEE